jgi:hypothetical protein
MTRMTFYYWDGTPAYSVPVSYYLHLAMNRRPGWVKRQHWRQKGCRPYMEARRQPRLIVVV